MTQHGGLQGLVETAVLRGDYDDALAALTVWLRFSAARLLTWNRNYNVKPREISAAQVLFDKKLLFHPGFTCHLEKLDLSLGPLWASTALQIALAELGHARSLLQKHDTLFRRLRSACQMAGIVRSRLGSLHMGLEQMRHSQALVRAGVLEFLLQSLQAERSVSAEVCRQFYELEAPVKTYCSLKPDLISVVCSPAV